MILLYHSKLNAVFGKTNYTYKKKRIPTCVVLGVVDDVISRIGLVEHGYVYHAFDDGGNGTFVTVVNPPAVHSRFHGIVDNEFHSVYRVPDVAVTFRRRSTVGGRVPGLLRIQIVIVAVVVVLHVVGRCALDRVVLDNGHARQVERY